MKHSRTLFFLLLALALHTNLIFSHTCVHDALEDDLKPVKLPRIDTQGRMLVDYQSLRILFDYSNLVLSDANLYDYIVNELIPPAKNYFSAALSIPKDTGKLTVEPGTTTLCKGAIALPSLYISPGVDADLVIFVTAQAEVGVDYVAYSSICLIDDTTFRPVGGRLHFNTNVIQQKNKEAQREADMVTTMHEITHILGFSSSVYSNYIDPATNTKLTGHLTNVLKNGITTQVLNLSPLTSRLQTYFGCNTMQGAYLENQGATGSLGSHFERRIFFNEYMTASRLNDARITEFTLALLEGSGWYKADYNMAEPMTWGKGKGCNFVDGPCVDTTVTPKVGKFSEFCSPIMERGCSWTGREGSMCGDFLIETSNSIPSGINWWANNTMMRDPYADNCPIYQAFSNTDCEDVDNIASTKIAGSASGYGSKCFMGTLSNTGTARPFGSYCFKATCESYGVGQKRLNVQVGSALGVCEAEGTIGIAGVAGGLSCPDPIQFCNVIENEGYCRRECMSRGTCVNKECQCVAGWGSMDCGKRVYTDCDKCRGDASKPSCYGDTCACDPSDTRCNGSGLTVVEIVGIAVGCAVFVITLILIIKYRKAIMARLSRKKVPSQQPVQSKPKRIKVEHTPSSAFSSPEQKKEPVTVEDSAAAASPSMKQVRLDFEEGKTGAGSNYNSPAKPLIGSKNQLDTVLSPKTRGDNVIGMHTVNDPALEKKGSQLRTLG